MPRPRFPNWPGWLWFVLILLAAIFLWSALNTLQSG
jgi:hypothetical protein